MSLAYYASSSPKADRSILKGRLCLVTGAASGLGLAITQAFLATGAHVAMVDIAPTEKGEAIMRDLPNAADRACYIQCDVTKWEDQAKAFRVALESFPGRTLDVVVVSAGVAGGMNLVDQVSVNLRSSQDEPEPPPLAAFQVNLIGAYYTAYLALHYFALQRQQPPDQQSTPGSNHSKSLIFISSLVAYMDYAETMYTSSKFGVRGLFRSIRTKAREQHDVRCNNIAPWHLRTAQTAALHKHFQARGLQEGKGYTFASLETLVEAVCQCAVNEEFSGRSIAIMPEGYVDLNEDFEDGYAGPEVTKVLQRRYDAGDQMYDPSKE